MNTRQMTGIALTMILCAAVLLRMVGIGSPTPYSDEQLVVLPALVLSLHDPNPHVFYYGSFPFYLFKIVAVLSDPIFHAITGQHFSLSQFYILFRLVSAFFGVATVMLCFILGQVLGSRLVGLIGATLVAVSPLSVNLSHTATVDATAGFWSALAWVAMALWMAGKTKWAPCLAGIATGLAIGTKYNAALLILPIALIALQLNRAGLERVPSRLRRWIFAGLVSAGLIGCAGVWLAKGPLLAAAASWTVGGHVQASYIRLLDRSLTSALVVLVIGLVTVGGLFSRARWACWIVDTLTSGVFLRPVLTVVITFVIAAPFVIFDPRASLPEITYQVNKTIIGRRATLTEEARTRLEATAGQAPTDRLYYLRVIKNEWGPLVAASMILGFWVLLRIRREAFIAYGAAALMVLAMSTGWRYDAPRYLYPIWPILCLFAALGMTHVLVGAAVVFSRVRLSRRFSQTGSY